MNDFEYKRYWRAQGTAESPAVPVPDNLVSEDWRLGHE